MVGVREGNEGYSIIENASLRKRNTFGVEARAAMLVDVHEPAALAGLFGSALLQARPVLALGEGSNVLLTHDWPGIVLSMATRGIEMLDDDGATARVRVQAGEHWNDFVHWSLVEGFSGLENLVLIPGAVDIELDWVQGLTQQHGFLHAGMVATALDSACGYAGFTLMPADAAVLTIEFKINLLAPAKGQRFRMEGRVLKPGRTITVSQGRAFVLDGGQEKLVATMDCTLMAVQGRDGLRG